MSDHARPEHRRSRGALLLALALWLALLAGFWWQAGGSELGAVAFIADRIEGLTRSAWAPLAVFGLYLVRPLLLIPITVTNIAAGFVLGAGPGMALAIAGTLASAALGYAMARWLTRGVATTSPLHSGRLPEVLRRNGFLSVAFGGLMYFHADAVNFPAGALRIPFPTFLAGIAVGNALTMSAAVLAGASVDGRLLDASLAIDSTRLVLAGGLFAVSIALAFALRARLLRREAVAGGDSVR